MVYDLVIAGGTIVSAEETIQADLGIQDGKIKNIAQNLSCKEVIDAAGLLVLPGAVDPHVHLEMPAGQVTSSDDWYTGTKAAACGGTTTVIDFVEPEPNQSLLEALEDRRTLADGKTLIDYALHMTLDRVDPQTLAEIPAIIAEGVTSFKCYTTYDLRLDDRQMLKAFKAVGQVGGIVLVHAESDAIVSHLQEEFLQEGKTDPHFHPLSRPAAAEGEAIERVLALAETAAAQVYIVHVSTGRGAMAIKRARSRGQTVIGETCPQYLLLTQDNFDLPGFEGAKFVCSPPLRTKEDQKALWLGLADGTLQTIGTDHCPFFYAGMKDLGRAGDDLPPFTQIPGGLPGIEARLPLLYSYGVGAGHFSVNRWVDLCSTRPAKAFGLYPKKGSLTPGADADLVLFDPNKKMVLSSEILHENVDYTPYEGLELQGYPVMTFLGGELIVKDGEFVGNVKRGSFLPRHIKGAGMA